MCVRMCKLVSKGGGDYASTFAYFHTHFCFDNIMPCIFSTCGMLIGLMWEFSTLKSQDIDLLKQALESRVKFNEAFLTWIHDFNIYSFLFKWIDWSEM